MRAGETVFVRINNGILTEGQVIEIHRDIVRIAGPSELAIVRAAGRPPLGIGFNVQDVVQKEKAKIS